MSDESFVGLLLERPVQTAPGVLLDYRAVNLEQNAISLLLPEAGESVPGIIYSPLTPFDYPRLDAYQGVGESLFERRQARGRSALAGELDLYVYVATEQALRRHLG